MLRSTAVHQIVAILCRGKTALRNKGTEKDKEGGKMRSFS